MSVKSDSDLKEMCECHDSEAPHLENTLKNLIKDYAELLEEARFLFIHKEFSASIIDDYFRDEDRLLKKLTEEYLK